MTTVDNYGDTIESAVKPPTWGQLHQELQRRWPHMDNTSLERAADFAHDKLHALMIADQTQRTALGDLSNQIKARIDERDAARAEVEALRAQVAEAQAMIPNEHALAVVRRMAYGFDWLGHFDDDDPLVLAFESWLATLPTPEAQP